MDIDGNERFVFTRFLINEADGLAQNYYDAAIEKLQTLFPGKNIVGYDNLTIGIETDSLYSDTGMDLYDLGLVDGEIPAIRNQRDGCVITFRP